MSSAFRSGSNTSSLVAMLVLVGCSGACSSPTTPEVCSTAALREVLKGELASFRDNNPFPGAVAAVHYPGLEGGPASVAIGFADIESGALLTPSDRLLSGSVGKTFFAAAALTLAEQGVLDLDAPIAGYLEDGSLPHADRVTARMLLSHRSGYGEYDGPFIAGLIENPLAVRTLADWTGPIRRSEALGQPGGDFSYSDVNFVLLAAVIEGAAGEPAYAVIDRLFLSPLGLAGTVRADRPEIPGLVSGYEGDQGLFGVDKVGGPGGLIYNPQFEWGGGGFASTAGDLAAWVSALRNGVAISDSSWSAMAELTDGDYGLGIHVYETPEGVAFGHSGYIPGYLSWMRWYEKSGLAVAVQANSSDGERIRDDGFDLLDRIARAVANRCPTRVGARPE